MTDRKTDPRGSAARLDEVVAEARRQSEARARSFREQALQLFPWVCGRCGREFNRRNLAGLTVHHRDHDHDHNPADGSNWELLCRYCHDNEHSRHTDHRAGSAAPAGRKPPGTYRPFADLQKRLRRDGD